ncbi:hypothetical protein BGZ65_002988, partial [Modicella reniformis]
FGSYVLAVLELIKYGVASPNIAVAPLTTFKVLEGIETSTEHDVNKNNIQRKLNDMISYIKEQLNHDSGAIERSMLTSASDLHGVYSFLTNPDPEQSLGDLFRTTGSNGGHGKWVCSSHHRQKYQPPTELLLDVVELNKGKVYSHQGKVVISCNYMATAAQLCDALQENHGVYELELTLQWDATKNDIQEICNALHTSNVSILRLNGAAFQQDGSDGRFDPIIGLLSKGSIQEFSLTGCNWFVDSIWNLRSYSFSYLRKLHLGVKPFEDASKERFFELLEKLSCMAHLSLFCSSEFNAYGLVHDKLERLPQLETLTLSDPESSDQKVVLHLKSQTAHCMRFGFHINHIIECRKELAKIVMPFQGSGQELHELKALDMTYNHQRELMVMFVEDEDKSVIEVEFRDPTQSYTNVPSGQHFRGLNSDMYIRWSNYQTLGFTDEPSNHHIVKSSTSSDSVVSFNCAEMTWKDETRKLLQGLATEPPRSIRFVHDLNVGISQWFVVCGLAALPWTNLSRLEIRGELVNEWIDDLHRIFTESGTPSLTELEISNTKPTSSSSELTATGVTWMKSMVSKSLSALALRGVKLQDPHWEELVSSISFSSLKTMDLTSSTIKREHAEKLLNNIPENAPLQSLKLHDIDWVRPFNKADCETFIATHNSKTNAKILF